MRTLVALASATVIAGAAFGMPSVFAWVHGAWWSFAGVGVYSHGYLVLGVAIWIGWKHWRTAPPPRLAPAWWGIVPLALLVLAMVGLELIYVGSSRALLLPPMFLASVLFVFGPIACRRLAVATLFVYFALLPWWMLDPALQALATAVVKVLMRFTEVPFYIEGFYIHVPAGTFEIAGACSGLSFLLSAVTLAVFYGIAFLRRWHHRAAILAAAITAAMVSNWIRIWTLILIGQQTELEHWLIEDHYFYGWVLFLIGLAPVLYLGRKLEDREAATDSAQTGAEATPHRPALAQVAPGCILASAAAALLLTVPRLFSTEVLATEATYPIELPSRLAVSAIRIDTATDWQPHFHNASQGHAVYELNGTRVTLFKAEYAQQNREAHLFHPRNELFSADWVELERSIKNVDLGESSRGLIDVHGQLERDQFIVWYWYEVAGQITTTRQGAKLAELLALPRGRSDGRVIALAARCEGDCAETRTALRRLLPTVDSGAGFDRFSGARTRPRPPD